MSELFFCNIIFGSWELIYVVQPLWKIPVAGFVLPLLDVSLPFFTFFSFNFFVNGSFYGDVVNGVLKRRLNEVFSKIL